MSFLAPKIVYVTCCDNGLYGLRHLHSMGVTIERVITISPELGDRYSVSGYADPSVWCKSVGVAVTSIEDYTIRVSDVENTSKELLLVFKGLEPLELIELHIVCNLVSSVLHGQFLLISH